MGDMDLEETQNNADSGVPQPPEKISEMDMLTLALARSKSKLALAEAKTAVAQSEKSELDYRYSVLQLYRKYGLNDQDAISEDGMIVRGGSKPLNEGQ